MRAVVRGDDVNCQRGGKEVHAADVAQAVGLLLSADAAVITGQAFNCYDRYISEFEVATMAKNITGSASSITGESKQPQHQIVTEKLRGLGMAFGGEALLEKTVRELIAAAGA